MLNMSQTRFNGKTILVVGGNSGIGFAAARAFSQEGAKIIISGRNAKTLASSVNDIGMGAFSYQCDISDLTQIEGLAAIVKSELGYLDGLFVSSAQCSFCSIESVTEEDWHWVMDTNLKGIFFTVQAMIPLMSNPSSIVLAGSIAGRLAGPNSSVYAASKAGVRSLARSLAAGLIEKGIRVNVVSPGPTDTPAYRRSKTNGDCNPLDILKHDLQNIPMKRLATPDEVANTVLFLASSDSSFITGAEILVDGGEASF